VRDDGLAGRAALRHERIAKLLRLGSDALGQLDGARVAVTRIGINVSLLARSARPRWRWRSALRHASV
jgi:hypothetical protein